MYLIEHAFDIALGIALVLAAYLLYVAATKGAPVAIAKAKSWWSTVKAWWAKGKADLEDAKSRLSQLESDVATIKQKVGL